MSKRCEDESAFPFVCQDLSKFQCHDPGMTLRAYFAGEAMAGMVSNPAPVGEMDAEKVARIAVALADAMIAELEREDEPCSETPQQ